MASNHPSPVSPNLRSLPEVYRIKPQYRSLAFSPVLSNLTPARQLTPILLPAPQSLFAVRICAEEDTASCLIEREEASFGSQHYQRLLVSFSL